jgi:hypothetical protein
MKTIGNLIGMVILAIITLNSIINLRAEDVSTNRNFSVKATSGVFNQYLAFASGIMVYDKPEVETDVLITHKPTGIYIDIWHGTGLNANFNEKKSLNDEVDLKIGWSKELGKGWGFDTGVSYFNEPSLSTLGKGDIWLSYLEINKSLKVYGQEIKAFTKVSSYTPNKGSGFKGDKVFDLGAYAPFTLTKKLSIFMKTGGAYITEGFGEQAGFSWISYISANWSVSSTVTLSLPQATFYVPLGWNGMKSDVVFGGSLSVAIW